jgi:hypothetical protein
MNIDGVDIDFEEEPFCEHCGAMPPFTPTVDPDCAYCLNCWSASNEAPDSLFHSAELLELTYRVTFYEKEIALMEERIEELSK